MLRTVMPVRSASSLIVISPTSALAMISRSTLRDGRSARRKREALAVHLRGGVGAEEGERLGDVLCGREGRELLAGALLAHPRGQDRVDDDDVGGRAAPLGEAVGEGQGPGLRRRLRGRIGGVLVG